MAAYIQKVCSAGMLVNVPTKNASISDTAAAVIEGPTSVIPPFIFSSKFYPWLPLIAVLIMNILSTPIAKIKKGITSPF